MEERRLLLAVALSLVVLTAYQFLFPGAPPPRRPVAGASPSASATPPALPPGVPVAGPASPAAVPSPTPPPVVAAVADEKERRVEVLGEDFELAFSNRGARLHSWRLTMYRDARDRPEEMVMALPGQGRPLDLETGDAALDARLREALFRPSRESVDARTPGATLDFLWAEGDVEAKKTLAFASGLVHVSAEVRRGGQPLPVRLLWGPGVGNPTADERAVQGYHEPQAVFETAEREVERVPPEKIGPVRSLPAVYWAGVESQYFTALLVPPTAPAAAELRSVAVGTEAEKRSVPIVALPLAPGTSAGLYVGPKDHSRLARLGHRLVDVVPVGDWIGPIVVALLGLLRAVHKSVGNYGWAIVLMTVVINALMAPLRHYSIANGLKMAKLAPEMRVIQERYRKVPALDPRRQDMQKEMAALYARHGMSMGTQMAVGCVPILITMPFLFAFYRLLTVAVEIRGADFLWIHDLSRRDPYFITPVLMAVTMFITQKLTPTGMDPAQQRIMMIMPVVFGVMFFAAPAGLNLYWLASNVCSIVQQLVTLRILEGQEKGAREARR